ncbi:MAG: hemerythrin domain-containing protein [Tissierellaceae bacterium]|nr:hemerythrin domain-containing protein [Tissierellaceae bacterium]
MESIKIMVEEHENIRRMLKVTRKVCYDLMLDPKTDTSDFPKIIDFVRTYADKHHHGKEEDILFTTMNREIEKLAKAGAITGMYIEHDMGRLYMNNLEKALEKFKGGNDEWRLDIIANAISYTDLLERHIEKENTAMYKFAVNMLDPDSKSYVDNKCRDIEKKAVDVGLQDKYLGLLKELENKYLHK